MIEKPKPRYVHPLVRKMRAYRKSHPELTEDELDEKMIGGALGTKRRRT